MAQVWYCCGCGIGWQLQQLQYDPLPGNFHMPQVQPKKEKKNCRLKKISKAFLSCTNIFHHGNNYLIVSFFGGGVFLGLHLWHVEVPRLLVQSELQLPVTATATAIPDLSHVCSVNHSSWQRWILIPLSETRD